MKLKLNKNSLLLLALIPILTQCRYSFTVQDESMVQTHGMHEGSSGEKKLILERNNFKIENYTTREILKLAEERTGQKYILVCGNDCNRYHTYSFKSKEPYKNEAFEKMVEMIGNNDQFILRTSNPNEDFAIYDSSLEKATFEIFNPEILSSMGIEDENKENLKHKTVVKRINNKYSAWNYSVDEFLDYYFEDTGIQATNETTYAPDQKLYFEFNGKETKSENGILYLECLCDDKVKVVESKQVTVLR